MYFNNLSTRMMRDMTLKKRKSKRKEKAKLIRPR